MASLTQLDVNITKQAAEYLATFDVVIKKASILLEDKANFELLNYKKEIVPNLSKYEKICKFISDNGDLFDHTSRLTDGISILLKNHQTFPDKLGSYICSTRDELAPQRNLRHFSLFQSPFTENIQEEECDIYGLVFK